jgi:hypothetical protein
MAVFGCLPVGGPVAIENRDEEADSVKIYKLKA